MEQNELKRPDLHLYDGLEDAPSVGEHFLITGPQGNLEAVLALPRANHAAPTAIGVVCHPHPLHGGTMVNKVVHILANTFNERGIATLRFNFRGVGHSNGRFDHGRGESEDLKAVVAWLRGRYPDLPLWLGGFSFGAFVALRTQDKLDIEQMVLVAPPVAMFDFKTLKPPVGPWAVIQGGKDEISSPEKVSSWVGKFAENPPQYIWLNDADHFFHGRLSKIREAVLSLDSARCASV